jgi:hypothetical protein
MQTITGRDGYIIAKALILALEHTKTRPDQEREWSDESDMLAILDARYASPKAMIQKERAVAAELAKLQARGATLEEITAHFETWEPTHDFVDKEHIKPLAADYHTKNRRDLNATIQGTLGAFRVSK